MYELLKIELQKAIDETEIRLAKKKQLLLSQRAYISEVSLGKHIDDYHELRTIFQHLRKAMACIPALE